MPDNDYTRVLRDLMSYRDETEYDKDKVFTQQDLSRVTYL